VSRRVVIIPAYPQHVFVFTADFVFKPSVSFRHPRKVLNVVPGDFTHTGKLDLLVMSESSARNQMDMEIYPALISDGFGEYLPKFKCMP
jgi:hypothetical protein